MFFLTLLPSNSVFNSNKNSVINVLRSSVFFFFGLSINCFSWWLRKNKKKKNTRIVDEFFTQFTSQNLSWCKFTKSKKNYVRWNNCWFTFSLLQYLYVHFKKKNIQHFDLDCRNCFYVTSSSFIKMLLQKCGNKQVSNEVNNQVFYFYNEKSRRTLQTQTLKNI